MVKKYIRVTEQVFRTLHSVNRFYSMLIGRK